LKKAIDKLHSKGTWKKLRIVWIELNLSAWAFEKQNSFISGYFDEVKRK